MRCKPGDLAVVVSAKHCKENIGSLVRVIRGGYTPWDWEVELLSDALLSDPSGNGPKFAMKAGERGGAFDRNLRPIRDPGDDATDEMVLLVGSPAKEPA